MKLPFLPSNPARLFALPDFLDFLGGVFSFDAPIYKNGETRWKKEKREKGREGEEPREKKNQQKERREGGEMSVPFF